MFGDSFAIKSIHGVHGGFDQSGQKSKRGGVWLNMVYLFDKLQTNNILPQSYIRKEIGNGSTTRFWKDNWIGGTRFMDKFPRLYALEVDKDCVVADRWRERGWVWNWSRDWSGGITVEQLSTLRDLLGDVVLNVDIDGWVWELDSDGIFTVSSARKYIDQVMFSPGNMGTRWCTYVPSKVNIFMWRVLMNRLPTRDSLVGRGIDVPSLLCTQCGLYTEDSNHVFLNCEVAAQIWNRIAKWLDLPLPSIISIDELMSWMDTVKVIAFKRKAISAIIWTTTWMISNYRNNVVFQSAKFPRSSIFEKIVTISFAWFSNRNTRSNINWTLWLQNPMFCN